MRKILVFWVPLLAWFLVIYNVSSTPASDLPAISIPQGDKLFHLVQYFVLGILLIRAFDYSNFNVSLAKIVFLAIIIAICIGVLDELHQRFVPGRSCDIFDFLVDCVGSFAGIFLYIADSKDRRG